MLEKTSDPWWQLEPVELARHVDSNLIVND